MPQCFGHRIRITLLYTLRTYTPQRWHWVSRWPILINDTPSFIGMCQNWSTGNGNTTRSWATAERQRVSYACLSRLANWSCNALNSAAVVQLYRLAQFVSTWSVKKLSDISGWLSFLTLYTFKVMSLCIIRKPLRAFIIIYFTNDHTSQDIWEMTLHNVKNYHL